MSTNTRPKFNKKKNFKNNQTNNKPLHPKFEKKKNEFKLKAGKLEEAEIELLKNKYEQILDPSSIKLFKDFPLSKKTIKGLNDAKYEVPTEIQKEAIGYSLQRKDVLASAITGSGKTLAFLIPTLECLYINKWTRDDGLGAIIISPTRELAYQIFETLKKVGGHHEYSAALIIGGKNLKFERKRMDQCNIIICTPGRLLQHMDENPLFNCDTLQIVVLDEADRCLDMGFEATMNAIIANFPPDRQTLLFSATQTKSVKDLARLSLKDHIYVSPKEQNKIVTPKNLQQSYVIINLEEKITMLWSFLKNHLKQKIIVFMACCKQVKYITEMFTKLRAGTTILGLYGTLHQDKRCAVYNEFVRKSNAVLICTDVASRGLDFPVINWVVQMDCPEDADAYIHRAGRTARHNEKGDSLLVLLPSEEEGMLEILKERNIPINKIFIDSKRLFSPRVKMEGLLAQNHELKATAQRAFTTYLKSVLLMKNKNIFKLDELDIDAYAQSLGLAVTPHVRFIELRRRRLARLNNLNGINENGNASVNDDDNDDVDNENNNELDKADKSKQYNFKFSDDDDESDEDDDSTNLFQVKRKDHKLSDDEDETDLPPLEEIKSKKQLKPLTKAAIAKRVMKKNILANTKLLFDDEGEKILSATKHLQSDIAKEYMESNDDDKGGIDIERAKLALQAEDKFDKERFKQMIKARHREEKRKFKQQNNDEDINEDVDDFGSDEEPKYTPDLSWLPDPDKIYKKNESTSNEQSSSENDDDDSDEEDISQIHIPPKKLISKKTKKSKVMEEEEEASIKPPPKKKQRKNIVQDLTVNEAEMIAMKLLNG